MTLLDLLERAASDLDGVSVVDVGGSAELRVADTVIAVVDARDGAEFRLDGAVASAAQRTPDTGASDRGPGWVQFRPATLDGHAADRAVAWLGFAARHATTR